MKKVYIIGYDVGDYRLEMNEIGFALTEEEAKLKVEELNKPYVEEKKVSDKCYECRRYEEDDYYEEVQMFRMRESCDKASIKTDRNGEYCENDANDRWQNVENWYFYRELSRMDTNEE